MNGWVVTHTVVSSSFLFKASGKGGGVGVGLWVLYALYALCRCCLCCMRGSRIYIRSIRSLFLGGIRSGVFYRLGFSMRFSELEFSVK